MNHSTTIKLLTQKLDFMKLSSKALEKYSQLLTQDNDDIFYVEAVGEHGYESEARAQNFEDARLQFNLKAAAIVETAAKRDATNSLRNRVGTMDIETKRTVVTRAAQAYMKQAEGKMSFSQERNVYIYRSVYTIELDYIVQLLKSE